MKFPDFSFEKTLWEKDYMVVGVDEVGRGAFAGPVVAGAAMLKSQALENIVLSLGINDSKKVSRKKRQDLRFKICKCFYVGIGKASVKEINNFGIVGATEKAMRRSIKMLLCSLKEEVKPFLLIDAFSLARVRGIGLKNQKAIIGGDGKSISIAAASIIAKLYRDSIMTKMGSKIIQYGWNSNMGYGTKQHLEGIYKYGVCKHHRKVFVDHLVY